MSGRSQRCRRTARPNGRRSGDDGLSIEHAVVVDGHESQALELATAARRSPRARTDWPARRARRGCPAPPAGTAPGRSRVTALTAHAAISRATIWCASQPTTVQRRSRRRHDEAESSRPRSAPSSARWRANASSTRVCGMSLALARTNQRLDRRPLLVDRRVAEQHGVAAGLNGRHRRLGQADVSPSPPSSPGRR